MAKKEATVTKAFKGVRDGETQARDFKVGDTIEGNLAEAMVTAGNAKPKQRKARGGAPKNKSKS